MRQTTINAKQLDRNMLTDLSFETEGQSIDWRVSDLPRLRRLYHAAACIEGPHVQCSKVHE
jgi:hypothetical protein